jgi:hypothetical protein
MRKWSLAIVYFLLLAGAVSAANSGLGIPDLGVSEPEDLYLTCGAERVMAFGTSHRSQPVAEFAAIVRWRHDAKANGKDFDNWSLAKERNIVCWKVPGGPYEQCKASAQPCRPKGTAP